MKISDGDLGWMAAIVDTKGKVSTKKNSKRATPQIVLRVDTTNGLIAERLCALTGNTPEPREMTPMNPDFVRRGCIQHCPEAHIHVEEERFTPISVKWSVTGTAMGIVIWNLRKYMATYPDYAPYMGLIFKNTVTKGQGVGQVRASVQRLKDLGWRIPAKIERELALSGVSA